MKTLLAFLFVICCSIAAMAQVTSKQIVFTATTPTVCNGGRIYAQTTTGSMYERLGTSGTTCTIIVNAGTAGTTGVFTAVTVGVGATSTALTDLLINPTTKGSGNLIDAQVNGSSKFSVSSAGNSVVANGLYLLNNSGFMAIGVSGDVTISRNNAGVIQIGNAALNASGSLLATNATFSGTLTNSGIASDAATTNNTVCTTTTTNVFTKGSGTIGICLGSSSAKVKHNLIPLAVGLNQVMELRPLSFNYNKNQGYDTNKTYYGFTAEAVAPIIPELAPKDANGNPLSVDLVGMVPVLVRAIQEQQAQILDLRRQVEELSRRPR